MDFYSQSFISYFIALSMFRIPDFDEYFKKQILIKPLLEVEEFRGGEKTEEKKSNAIGHLFDWKTHFYAHIPEGKIHHESQKILNSIMKAEAW